MMRPGCDMAADAGRPMDDKPQPNTTNAMVASPSVSTREAIRAAVMTLPGMRVAACAADHSAIASALAAEQPRVLVIDMTPPDSEALALIRWIRQAHPAVAILAVALSGRQRQVALAAGADGAVLLTAQVAQVAEAMAHIIGRDRPDVSP
jgi:DNA-binding NarL/FixJ family response regulator